MVQHLRLPNLRDYDTKIYRSIYISVVNNLYEIAVIYCYHISQYLRNSYECEVIS